MTTPNRWNVPSGIEGESNPCQWFMVPQNAWHTIEYALGHPLGGNSAQAKYLCGQAAIAARAQGLTGYPTAAEAEKAPTNDATTTPLGSLAKSLPSGLTAIGDFFARLTETNTWIRIGEGLIGGVLILIAVTAALKKTDVGQAAGTLAKTAGVAAVV